MKKLLPIFLALCLVLSMSTVAFADTNLNIQTGEDNRTYNGYKLLDLSISLKKDNHHPANCDGNHKDDCYNYAYKVNGKYRGILKNEVFKNAGTNFWGANGAPVEEDITDAQILEYLETFTSDNGSTSGTLRPVADRIYRAIKAAGLDADATGMTGVNDKIGQGYWMIADVTDLKNQNKANSLVMIDTKGESNITVTPKTAIPTLEKKVKDIEDSEDDKIGDNPWHDAADFDIGDDDIPFKLTGTLPSNARGYETYELKFHDTMSSGLALNEESIKVMMYETKHKADVDTDMNDGADITNYFKIVTDPELHAFTVGCENVFAINGVTKDTTFVVYYEATLNEYAVIGAEGNPNEAYLEYSNNPYSDGTGKTKKDKVEVYTYQLTVNKTDSHGHALQGAGFTLSKKNLDGEYVAVGEEIKGDAITTFTWEGLDDGDYKLVETTVPQGYNKMADIEFSISATHSETADDPELLSLDGGKMGMGDVVTGIITKDIENHTGTVLPETGARGTMLLIFGGAMLVMLAAIFMITRKRMSVYED